MEDEGENLHANGGLKTQGVGKPIKNSCKIKQKRGKDRERGRRSQNGIPIKTKTRLNREKNQAY